MLSRDSAPGELMASADERGAFWNIVNTYMDRYPD